MVSRTLENAHATNHSWFGVLAIALGAFALVVTEFLPVGLLPGISRDLGISEGSAGLAVTATALLGFLAAPITAMSIGKADRRLVLLGFTVLLIISSVMAAMATSFAVLLLARVVLGIGVGGFWAISVTAAARLVAEEKVHSASSTVFAGISIGSVVSVPAGSYIGAHYDWRIAFMAASVLAVVVLLIQLMALPKILIDHGVKISSFFGLLKSPKVRAIFLTVIFIVAGQYSGYTFVTPYLEQVTRVDNGLLNTLLFVYGVATVLGNFLGGFFAGRNLHLTVVATVVIFLVSLVSMSLFATNALVVTISLCIWAISWGMAPVGTQLWLYNATRNDAEAAQAVNTSVFQFSIALGSLIGGAAVNNISLHSSMWIGALILALAVLMVFLVGRMDRKD
ncbi:MFS transporter [Pseudomonas gingeri]|nr:MFS transporter [Pseudomonas gingeri]NWE67801.1 MFS transporter [Pseudomonas gingeri]